MSIVYDCNSKLVSSDVYSAISIEQLNGITKSLIEHGQESLLKITPEPDNKKSLMIKAMFEKSVGCLQNNSNNFEESLKYAKLAIDMMIKSRSFLESFQVQLQELRFMLKHKLDVSLAIYQKNFSKKTELMANGQKMTKIEFIKTPESEDLLVEALQDIEMLFNAGLIGDPNMSLRKCDVLMKLTHFEDAKIEAERGLSLFTAKAQDQEFMQSLPKEQRDGFLQVSMKLKSLYTVADRYVKEYNGDL